MNAPLTMRERLRPLHVRPSGALSHFCAAVVHVSLIVSCVWFWESGLQPISVFLWFVIAWMNHALLAQLHESAHHMLYRSNFINEFAGVAIGTLSLTPLSVYRYVHTQHHAHLGREKDPEFRPYNQPEASRAKRVLYAVLKLTLGWFVTPFLYSVRTARRWNGLTEVLRRRLVVEWMVMVVFWLSVIVATTYTAKWMWLLVGQLAPAWITGTLQTIRKFTEHMGRFGDNIYDMTRTVVYDRPLGRLASLSQLHVELHGIHHRWPRIPYHKLPEATEIIFDANENQQGRIFPSHYAAIRDMLPHLFDPKVGPQWKRHDLEPRFVPQEKKSAEKILTDSTEV